MHTDCVNKQQAVDMINYIFCIYFTDDWRHFLYCIGPGLVTLINLQTAVDKSQDKALFQETIIRLGKIMHVLLNIDL